MKPLIKDELNMIEKVCPDCEGKGYSLKQGCLVATRIPCRYCDGTGKANTLTPKKVVKGK